MITRCVLSQVIDKKPNKEKCLVFKSKFSLKIFKCIKTQRITVQNAVG